MSTEFIALPSEPDGDREPTLSQLVRNAGLMDVKSATPGFGYPRLGFLAMRAAVNLGNNMLDSEGKGLDGKPEKKRPLGKMIVVFGGEPVSAKTRYRYLVHRVLDHYANTNLYPIKKRATRFQTVTWEKHGLFPAMAGNPGAVPSNENLELANKLIGDAAISNFWHSNVLMMEAPLITGVPLNDGWLGQPRCLELVRQMIRREGKFDLDPKKYPFDVWLVMMRGGLDFRASMTYYRELMKRARNLKEMREIAARYGKNPDRSGNLYPINYQQGLREQRQGATLVQTRNIEGVVNRVTRQLINHGKLDLPDDIDLSPLHEARTQAIDRLSMYVCQEIGIPLDRVFIGANEPTLEELGVNPAVIIEDKQRLEPTA